MSQKIFCGNCGKPLSADAAFCGFCGQANHARPRAAQGQQAAGYGNSQNPYPMQNHYNSPNAHSPQNPYPMPGRSGASSPEADEPTLLLKHAQERQAQHSPISTPRQPSPAPVKKAAPSPTAASVSSTLHKKACPLPEDLEMLRTVIEDLNQWLYASPIKIKSIGIHPAADPGQAFCQLEISYYDAPRIAGRFQLGLLIQDLLSESVTDQLAKFTSEHPEKKIIWKKVLTVNVPEDEKAAILLFLYPEKISH